MADQNACAETENPPPTDEKEFKCFIAEPSSLDSSAVPTDAVSPERVTVKAEAEDPFPPSERSDESQGYSF